MICHRTGLLLAYLGLIPLAKVTVAGWPLPELFFPLLLIGTATDPGLRSAFLRARYDALDASAAILVAATSLSWWINYPDGSPRDVLILVYLAVVFRLTRLWVSQLSDPIRFLERAMVVLGSVLVLSGLASWVYYAIAPAPGFEVVEPKYLPGSGFLPRLEGLTMSPNLFFNLCQLPLLVLLATAINGSGRSLRRLAFGLCLLLIAGSTLSKSLPLLFAGSLGLMLWRGGLRGPGYYLGWTLCAAALLIFLVGPKVILLRDDQPDRHRVAQQSYFAGDTLGRVGPYTIYASTHLALNRLALDASAQRPLFGHGPGTFRAYVAEQQNLGRYPERLPRYDPHQLYLGTLAETGLVSFVALLCWLWQLGKKGIGEIHLIAVGGYAGLIAYLLLWVLEGWHMDTLHFRQFWWAAGVVAALSDAAREAARANPEKPAAPTRSGGKR